jgi:hypothetical protein
MTPRMIARRPAKIVAVRCAPVKANVAAVPLLLPPAVPLLPEPAAAVVVVGAVVVVVVGAVVVVVVVAGVVVVVVVDGVTKLLVIVVMQVTALPPPVAVPLHWLTVTGSADAAPVTVQPTVVSPL